MAEMLYFGPVEERNQSSSPAYAVAQSVRAWHNNGAAPARSATSRIFALRSAYMRQRLQHLHAR